MEKKVEEVAVEKENEVKDKCRVKKKEVKGVLPEVTPTKIYENNDDVVKSPKVPRTRARKVEGSSVKVLKRGEQDINK